MLANPSLFAILKTSANLLVMNKKLAHYFIPHPETHKKAKLISWHYLLIYILLFILLRTSIDIYSNLRPGVLGISSDMTVSQVIGNTNKERQAKGLSTLTENSSLDAAAAAKARNMLEENYWAHYSPSGKDPWGFIKGAGYRFTYAGENLARGFYNANDVVAAWMNSPSHRDNLLNPKYKEIGIAVVEGTLQGQQTVLVVQMFGTPYEAVALAPTTPPPAPQVVAEGKKITLPPETISETPETPDINIKPVLVAGTQSTSKPVADPYMIMKVIGVGLVIFIAGLLTADLVVLRRRGVFRVSSHHLVHISFLILLATAIIVSKIGNIL